MRGKLLGLSVIALSLLFVSGCAWKYTGPHNWKMEPGGISDWIEVQPGAQLTNVDLPTPENKNGTGQKYTVVVKKPSALVSLDMIDRMGK